MKKKKVSKIRLLPDDPYIVIGLSCNDNDYRVSWDLNKLLGLRLTKESNHIFLNSKAAEQSHSQYTFVDEESGMRYYLLANKSDEGYILEQYRNIDFFIQIVGKTNAAELDSILSALKRSDIISAAFQIPIQNIKAGMMPY